MPRIRNGSFAVASTAVAALVAATGAVATPAWAVETSGRVVSETLSTGNTLSVYLPANTDLGYRAVSTPILLVLTDAGVTTEEARLLAEQSGLAEIAHEEQGVVAFLNPAGGSWSASDASGVTAVLERFGDSTGQPYADDGKLCATDWQGVASCKYPGSKARTYIFADRRGADFAHQHVVPGITSVIWTGQTQTWTPTGLYSSNATVPAVAPAVAVDVPAYAVNASRQVESSLGSINERFGLYATDHAPKKDTFTSRTVRKAYSDVLRYAIQRGSLSSNYSELFTIADFNKLKVTVEHNSISANGAPLEYFSYTPTRVKGKMPVVFLFHGGGNHAEFLVWAGKWAELAAEEGFKVISVNRHVERSASDVMVLVDAVAKDPAVDTTRIYASGFSMGSVKSFALQEEFGERFAAFAPMSGSFSAATYLTDSPVPTIYFAGLDSPLPERPHQAGTANNIDARIQSLFAQNDVTDSYSFDPAKDAVWGFTPTSSTVVDDSLFAGVSVRVSYFASADGAVNTALAAVTKAGHEVLPIEASVAWDFMSKFSRGVDGSVVGG